MIIYGMLIFILSQIMFVIFLHENTTSQLYRLRVIKDIQTIELLLQPRFKE